MLECYSEKSSWTSLKKATFKLCYWDFTFLETSLGWPRTSYVDQAGLGYTCFYPLSPGLSCVSPWPVLLYFLRQSLIELRAHLLTRLTS